MQIRRYTGPSLPEVLRQIDRELGPNAAILHTRHLRSGGFFGLLGRPAVEVTVGVDFAFRLPEDDVREREAAPPADPRVMTLPPPGFGAGPRPERPGRAPRAGRTPAPAPAPLPPEDPMLVARRELNEMRVKPRATAAASAAGPEPALALSEELEKVHRALVRNGVEESLARRLLRTFDEQMALLNEDFAKAAPRLERYLAGLIRTAPGIRLADGRKPLVAAFIGPTGVGKTTTIAKVASHFALNEHARVAMITSDTYRMGATDQIKRYGEILGLPVSVVETPEEMEQALLAFTGYDLVLVDTAGRSPQNKDQILQLKALMEAARPDEVHLVVSMTTKYIDVLSIVARFGIVPVNRLILTKFDETRHFGLALNMSVNFAMSIAYCTVGQQVPDDLEAGDPLKLARLVLAGPEAQTNGRSSR